MTPSIAFPDIKPSARSEVFRAASLSPALDTAYRQAEQSGYKPRGHSRRPLALAVLLIHLLLAWGFLQLDHVRRAVQTAAPLVVRLLAAPSPPVPLAAMAAVKAPDLPPRSLAQVPPPLFEITQSPTAAPTITVAVTLPTVVSAVVSAVVSPVVPETVAATPRGTAAPTVAQPGAVTPTLKRIAPGSVRYRVEPRLTMPLMSKRLHESGIVYLLIAVDARGQLSSATVQKSSGFARLDAQALQDIRSARFVPHTENGQTIDWETVAPMSYELD